MNLRLRFLLAFLVPAAVCLSLGGALLNRLAENSLEEQLGNSLSRVAASVSSQLKAERVFSLVGDDAAEGGTRTYKALHTAIEEIRERTEAKRILIFDKENRARLDVGGPHLPMSEASELWRDGLEIGEVLQGRRVSSQVLFTGADGQPYKTGYAPVFLNDVVIGGVGVEGQADFFGPLAALRVALLSLGLLTFLLLTAAAVASAELLGRPIARLVESALRIGRGDLVTHVALENTAELTVLSREVESMRIALQHRESQLKMMLAGVAHEVKNPLGGMELFTGLLQEELSAPQPNLVEAHEHARKIQRELKYLTRIVDDFLSFAREQKLQHNEVQCRALLTTAGQLVAAEALEKSVALEMTCDDIALKVDESLIIGALLNLLKNALQASVVGQTIHVRARASGACCEIEIEDAGSGISPGELPSIFEPFFTTKEKGTGLGLPLTKKIAEAHGGSISVRSRPGQTCFTLRLPLP
jgi:signal transduction histidine kinase